MRSLGIIDKFLFGPKFDSIREAGKMYDEWQRRFDAQENTKTLSALPDMGTTTEAEVDMVVDTESVRTSGRKGKGRQLRKMPAMEVTISKAPTPVSVRILVFVNLANLIVVHQGRTTGYQA